MARPVMAALLQVMICIGLQFTSVKSQLNQAGSGNVHYQYEQNFQDPYLNPPGDAVYLHHFGSQGSNPGPFYDFVPTSYPSHANHYNPNDANYYNPNHASYYNPNHANHYNPNHANYYNPNHANYYSPNHANYYNPNDANYNPGYPSNAIQVFPYYSSQPGAQFSTANARPPTPTTTDPQSSDGPSASEGVGGMGGGGEEQEVDDAGGVSGGGGGGGGSPVFNSQLFLGPPQVLPAWPFPAMENSQSVSVQSGSGQPYLFPPAVGGQGLLETVASAQRHNTRPQSSSSFSNRNQFAMNPLFLMLALDAFSS